MYQIGNNTMNLHQAVAIKARHLAEASYSVDNPGLYRGKAGILLGLHGAAKYVSNVDALVINEAIRQLQEDISENAGNADDSYRDGLFGIGWAVSTLYEDGYIEENKSDVLNSFDDALYKLVMYQKAGSNDLETGTMGRINYYLKRIGEELKRANKYRYVCNYECLMLLVDDFTHANEAVIERAESGIASVLAESGTYYASIFNLLSRLVQKSIHPEITEKQHLRLLRLFVRYFDSLSGGLPVAFEDEKVYWSTVAVLNCLLHVSKESAAVAKRIGTERHLGREPQEISFDLCNDGQRLASAITHLRLHNCTVPENAMTNCMATAIKGEGELGLNGVAAFLCVGGSKKNRKIQVINEAFLL